MEEKRKYTVKEKTDAIWKHARRVEFYEYIKKYGWRSFDFESVDSIAERVFPEEVKEIRRPAPHIDSDRMIGPTDWDRECQESERLNKR